jgi:GNAT superfamily N-acetyltransferase
VDATLLELSEEAGLWMPVDPEGETIVGDGYCMRIWGRRADVERIRLGDVEAAVEEVRGHARERGVESVTWWVGELSTPAGLAETLLALGFVPDPDQPHLTSLTITSRPAGEPSVEVRRVEAFDDYLRAIELDWEVWQLPADDRAARREAAPARWESLAADGRVSHYLAYLDGEPAGFGRVVFAPGAGLLMGGAVLPEARGRGVYTALVHARWDEAVERGTPRLIVGAGSMSAPILERLGFERIGAIHLLRDRLDANGASRPPRTG